MDEPDDKEPAPYGVGFYLKHIAIAFAIGITILGVTYVGLALIYGPFVPFESRPDTIVVRPKLAPLGR